MRGTGKASAVWLIGILAAVMAGCPQTDMPPIPHNIPEYEQMARSPREGWSNDRIVQLNTARVQDEELTTEERIASLELVERIGTVDSTSMRELAALLEDPDTPAKLNREVLKFLMEKNYAGIDAILVSAWPEIQKDPELRRLAIRNMGEQPGPYRLARLVRGWANEKNLNPETEATYRQTIEQATGQPWDEALLSALDSEDFDAKGAAMEILHRQMDAATLRGRITALQGKSDTVLAIQYFLETFNYLPRGGEELTSSVVLYRVRRDMLPAAAKLALDWTKNYNYAFNIRDFHLLSRLTRDPLRNNLKRTQLVLDVGQAVKTRKHVEHTPDMPGGADDYEESFWLQVDNLTMADLWNLYLINEMLSRPRVQGSLRLMADADLADPNSAWGGLVFYQNGQAEAILYPPDPNAPANDLAYQPTPQLTTDGRDALCRFIGHFELLNNSLRAGPTAQELSDAATSNYYGLILTRTGENSFAAHYYNPRGNVVSLGRYPLQ